MVGRHVQLSGGRLFVPITPRSPFLIRIAGEVCLVIMLAMLGAITGRAEPPTCHMQLGGRPLGRDASAGLDVRLVRNRCWRSAANRGRLTEFPAHDDSLEIDTGWSLSPR